MRLDKELGNANEDEDIDMDDVVLLDAEKINRMDG
jgi:hypothetical protein